MSTTSEIMQRVYSSDGFKQKGYSLNLKDAFLVPISAHAYIERILFYAQSYSERHQR